VSPNSALAQGRRVFSRRRRVAASAGARGRSGRRGVAVSGRQRRLLHVGSGEADLPRAVGIFDDRLQLACEIRMVPGIRDQPHVPAVVESPLQQDLLGGDLSGEHETGSTGQHFGGDRRGVKGNRELAFQEADSRTGTEESRDFPVRKKRERPGPVVQVEVANRLLEHRQRPSLCQGKEVEVQPLALQQRERVQEIERALHFSDLPVDADRRLRRVDRVQIAEDAAHVSGLHAGQPLQQGVDVEGR
jgi:hypothetical protein